MSPKSLKRIMAVGLLLIGGCVATTMPKALAQAQAETSSNRKTKSKIAPTYPDLARRMHITGVVKIQVMVAANGAVRDTKLVGGHPVLANSVLDAVKKWRFEPAPQETTETLEFRFDPND